MAEAPPDDPIRFDVPRYSLAEAARLLEVLRLEPPVSDHLEVDPHAAAIARLRAGDPLNVVADDFDVPKALLQSVWEALAA